MSSSSSSTSLSNLIEWLHSVGIWWDESLMQIRGGCSGCSGPALGVFALTGIQENQLLCVIPRSAILSPRTTQLANILEEEKIGGGLGLTIAVMYEASLGPASKWAGYFASLPRREYVPMFWGEDELQLLKGTALEGQADDDRRDTQEDYEAHVVPLMQRHKEAFPHPELCSLDHFRIAASWVSSRSFHVDSWHGDAMVPLADIFNHKASLVLLGDSWGLAEELDRQQQHHHHDDEEGESSEETEQESEQDSEGGGQGPSEEGEESDEEDEESAEGEEEDPQHGFAVGGMPVIAGAAAAAGGIVHKAAGTLMRDGVNLRLEIGICSMGEADASLAAGPEEAAEEHRAQHLHRHDHYHKDGGGSCGGCNAAAAAAAGGGGGKRQHAAESQQAHKKHKKEQDNAEQQQPDKEQQPQQPQQQQQFPDKRLEIIAASPVAAHAEIHNTYGEHSNRELLHKYGFCLPANPFDELQLGPSWAWLLEVTGAAKDKRFKQHIKWLRAYSDLLPAGEEVEADDDEAAPPPVVTPGGRLPSPVAAVVRLLGASASQLKAWSSLADVLELSQIGKKTADDTDTAAAAAAAGKGDQTSAAAAHDQAEALAEHFDDLDITSRDLEWWGKGGLELLQQAVQQRVQQYPSKGFRIAEDEKALQAMASEQQWGDAGEHAAAAAAALQLRITEQRILQQTLDAVQQVLGST